MNDDRCAEFRRFVGPYIDGEFEIGEAAVFEEHLSQCSECRAYYDQQTWLISAVKPILQRPSRLPEDAKARLENHLRQARKPDYLRRVSRFLTHPIPVAVVATGLLFFFRPGLDTPHSNDTEVISQGEEMSVKVEAPLVRVSSTVPGVSEAVNQHLQAMPIERPTPEHADVERWFVGKLPFNVNALRFRDRRVNLLGGRISRFRTTEMRSSLPAARLFYQVGGHKMSVLVLNQSQGDQRGTSRRVDSGDALEIHDAGDYRVATLRHNGLTYMLTSDLASEAMRSVIESAR